MTHPRDYPSIDEFLGDPGPRSDTIEENLSVLSRHEFEDLDSAFTYVDHDEDPVGDWKNDIYDGKVTSAFAEITLVWHFRRELGHDSVELNPEYTSSGRDFDLRVNWQDREYWIEVTSPRLVDQVDERDGGFIPKTRTTNAIDRKLRNEFETARETLDDHVILVLGVYLEMGPLQSLIIGEWLSKGHYHPGECCDAFMEFMHVHGKTTIEIQPLTKRGEHVTELRDRLIQGQTHDRGA